MMAYIANFTSTQIIIKTAIQDIPASTSIAITITGLTMGRFATAGGQVSVATSADTLLSEPVQSGPIRGAVSAVSFHIAASDRVIGKAGVSVTFSFKTSAGGALESGGTITLMYPVRFFSGHGTHTAHISLHGPGDDVHLGGTVTLPSMSHLVITTSDHRIGENNYVTVSVTGMTLGDMPTSGDSVSVATSADELHSASSAASGVIGGAVSSVGFRVASADRVINKPGVAATFTFTTSAGGALAAGGAITLSYPSGFFAAVGTPGVVISGDGATASAATPSATQIILIVSSGSISASTSVSLVLSGLTMGSQPMTGRLIGFVNVSTSSDPLSSSPADAGPINSNSGPSTTHFGTTAPVVTSPPAPVVPPPDHPVVIVILSGSIYTFSEESERRKSFISGLASILAIDKWQIVIRSVRPGSVIVELEFLRNANSSTTPLEVTNRLQSASLSGKLEVFGVEGLTIGGKQAHTGIQPSNGISCFVGTDLQCSSQFSVVSSVRHRWDACWSCKNTVFRTLFVGGCFNNASSRLLSPTCLGAKDTCLTDGRTASSFSTCATSDCNACSTAARSRSLSAVLWVTLAFSTVCAFCAL
jgi:hypothetical protein